MVLGMMPVQALVNKTDGRGSETLHQFTDVRESDWFYYGVLFASQNDIFKGTSETRFSPQGHMTRAMFVTTLGRFVGIDALAYTGTGGFSDVDSTAYYCPYVSWALEKGITSGVDNGLFSPDTLVTREQLAVFTDNFLKIYSAANLSENRTETSPKDVALVSSWAAASVQKLWNAGILNGDVQGNLALIHTEEASLNQLRLLPEGFVRICRYLSEKTMCLPAGTQTAP